MTIDLTPVHPELRRWARFFPRFTARREVVPLVRTLGALAPRTPLPAGLRQEQVLIPTPDGEGSLRLRIYLNRKLKPPLPALVWMHGGGYVFGRVRMDNHGLLALALDPGMVIVCVEYRLAGEHPFPIPLEDCYAALKWTQAQADRLGIDPLRIAVGGASAGGGLAACLAQLAHDRGEVQPAFQLLIYPMLDDRTCLRTEIPHADLLTWTPESNRFGWGAYLGQPPGAEQLPSYAAAARREHLAGLAPAWIGVGTLDLFHDEDLAYAARLQASGVTCDLLSVPGAFHGFDVLGPHLEVVRDFRRSQVAALKSAL